jgi:hypothetical protein
MKTKTVAEQPIPKLKLNEWLEKVGARCFDVIKCPLHSKQKMRQAGWGSVHPASSSVLHFYLVGIAKFIVQIDCDGDWKIFTPVSQQSRCVPKPGSVFDPQANRATEMAQMIVDAEAYFEQANAGTK